MCVLAISCADLFGGRVCLTMTLFCVPRSRPTTDIFAGVRFAVVEICYAMPRECLLCWENVGGVFRVFGVGCSEKFKRFAGVTNVGLRLKANQRATTTRMMLNNTSTHQTHHTTVQAFQRQQLFEADTKMPEPTFHKPQWHGSHTTDGYRSFCDNHVKETATTGSTNSSFCRVNDNRRARVGTCHAPAHPMQHTDVLCCG